MEVISSPKIKYIKRLTQKKYRAIHNQYLVEGEKMVAEAIINRQSIKMIVVRDDKMDWLKSLTVDDRICYSCDEHAYQNISQLKTPPGVLAVLDKPEIRPIREHANKILYLDAISDPGNMGSIIRTGDWFGFDAIILGPGCVDPYNIKCVQATMGSIYGIPIIQTTLADFKASHRDFTIVGTDVDGENLSDVIFPEKVIGVIGSESHGMDSAVGAQCDMIVRVDGAQKKIAESLNAGVASAIFCYVLFNAS